MLSALGFSLGATKGYAAAELEPVYARARELCAQIHDPVHDFRALLGQWVIRWTKLELRDALQLADELMTAAEDVKDPAMLLYGTFARGTTLLLLGELVSGNEYLEKALAVFDLRQPLPGILELCRITSFGHLYSGLSWLGYPDRADVHCPPKPNPPKCYTETGGERGETRMRGGGWPERSTR